MTFLSMIVFLLMILFGGIAVDVMRYEMRRVQLQQTLDRAALAAASLTQTRTPQQVVNDWFLKSGLSEEFFSYDFGTPTVAAIADAGLRRVTVDAQVRSDNFFMSILSDNNFLEGPAVTQAAQGVSNIEVMLVLDITGSMNEPLGDGRTKIQALREAATAFVDIVEANDTQNGVSIGVIPYAAQVNVPANLRAQFTVQHLSAWDGVALAGVPNINCLEFPTSGFGTTAVSLTTPIPMAAVADANSSTTTNGSRVAPQGPNATSRACTTNAETGSTPWVDAEVNQVLMPTKNGDAVKTKIQRLTANGNTYIAVGMRWATALMDEAARPIYTAIGDASVQGRPANNDSLETRKIIILMTDGEHVTNNHIRDAYKSGLSPIWRGSDGNYAIRFNGGPGFTGGTRPGCAGSNTYFLPHLQPNTACVAAAWVGTPSWTGSGTVRQLDWSEVWRFLRVSWVAQHLYVRSGVTGSNITFNNVMNDIRQTYLTSVANMNSLLQQNCAIARKGTDVPVGTAPVGQGAGIEIYGIAFAAPTNGQNQIRNCSSTPQENYYFNAANSADLLAAFQQIATDISDLRLTQ